MTDRQQIAPDWATRGFSCNLWTDPAGQRWEDFREGEQDLRDKHALGLDGNW